jgi:hypothetical protein
MSAPKVSRVWLIGCCLTLTLGLVVLAALPAANAHDSQAQPTCCACHTWEDPVVEHGEWHTIHALQINCCACHTGNDHAINQAAAHAGMMPNPLDNPQLCCQHCHPSDYQQRTAGVAVALGFTPGNRAPIAYPPASSIVTPWPQTSFRGWDWPVELAISIVALGLGVMRWRRVHSS